MPGLAVVGREQLLFECLHHRGLGVLFVVHPEQVQDPVHEQQSDLILVGPGMLGCLPPGDLRADDDVADEKGHLFELRWSTARPTRLLVRDVTRADELVLDRERQHVRGALAPEEPLVEAGDGPLVDEHEREFSVVADAAVGEHPFRERHPAGEIDRSIRLLVGSEDLSAHFAGRWGKVLNAGALSWVPFPAAGFSLPPERAAGAPGRAAPAPMLRAWSERS